LLLSHSITFISILWDFPCCPNSYLRRDSIRKDRLASRISSSSTLSDSYAGIELPIDAELIVLQHDCGGTIGQF